MIDAVNINEALSKLLVFIQNRPIVCYYISFDTIMDKLELPILGKHDALNDAIMSAMIFLKLKDIPLYKGAYS